mmetsp:Transcript_25456/g.73020  ORF Transcript_25456/g.73020 Transcript_25456/m.73020 type:complete len:540 (+) Transcript_25456:85-1704(+)
MAPLIFYLHLLLSLTRFPRCLASRQTSVSSEELDTEELGVQSSEDLGGQASEAEAPERPGHSGSCGFLLFSDMDDTMACSKEKLLHGIDRNCRKAKVVYPGLGSFYWNLARGPEEACKDPPKVVPLSARPEKVKDIPLLGTHFVAIKADDPPNQELLRIAASEGGKPDWGLDIENAIYGKLKVLQDVLDGDFTAIANKKVKGWKKRAATATLPMVFIGDNGQGDVLAAMRMRSSTDPHLAAAFVHHVQPWASPTSPRTMLWKDHTTPGNEEALTPKHIFLFQNYAEAACRAVSERLMRPDGYTQVMTSIKKRCFDGCKDLCELPENFAAVDEECRVLFPEFGLAGQNGPLYIREPEACNRARVFARDDFRDLTGLLVWAGGWLSVGKCTDVTGDVLRMIAYATQFVHEHQATASKESDFGEFYHKKGLTTLLLQAVHTGFHCIASCEETFAHAKDTFEDQHRNWTLEDKSPLKLRRVDRYCGGTSLKRLAQHAAQGAEGAARRTLGGTMGNLLHAFPDDLFGLNNFGRSVLKIIAKAEP